MFAWVGKVLNFTIHDDDNFFIASETVHFVGILFLIHKLIKQKTCSGLSLKTQELTAIFLAARLLCSVVGVDIHTVLDFATLVSTVWVIYIIRFRLKADKDDFPQYYLLVPAAVLAILVHPNLRYLPFVRFLWAFCVYLESVSVLPQLCMMQKAKMIEPFTAYYMFTLGISRFFGLAHWALQVYKTGGRCMFLIKGGYIWPLFGYLTEIVQTFIFAGLCYYYMKRAARKEALNWTSEMDGVLLRSLLEEQDKGNRVDGIWTSSGLQNVARTCTEKFRINVDKEKVINRQRTLKDDYNMWHDLFRGASGFSWSRERKYFVAEPEVWNHFIQGKPEAAKWRHTSICHYDKLEALFGKDKTRGKGITSDKNTFPAGAGFSKKLKNRTTTQTIEKQTEVFQAGILGLTELLKEGIMILKETRPRVYGEGDVYQELIAIGVPKYRLVDSMVYLTKNPSDVRALFGVPSALRKEMLFKLMNK